ncbi:MAG: bifunctional adenosylcobinamide kinase/adenosylcobinamide-phosphate guanylyltransferase [Actinomycetota bacterium]|nr:bifunctional adenosylcobinamide kinase/adenosylcobinamide-phosphate guanylyltransferase [Actinomycetota bacterium]
MSDLILILGGARSGKGIFAEKMVKSFKKVAYLATAEALDEEMLERIENHKKQRPGSWVTLEVPHNLVEAFRRIDSDTEAVVVDCLTLYISNQMTRFSEEEILEEVSELLDSLETFRGRVIFVSNEVGMGIVPAYRMGRDYRDILGKVNQVIAEVAGEVYLLVAGIPWRLK